MTDNDEDGKARHQRRNNHIHQHGSLSPLPLNGSKNALGSHTFSFLFTAKAFTAGRDYVRHSSAPRRLGSAMAGDQSRRQPTKPSRFRGQGLIGSSGTWFSHVTG